MRNFLKDLDYDMRKWPLVFAIAFGLIALAAQAAAQAQDPPPATNWTVGADFGPGPLVSVNGVAPLTGSIRASKGDRAIDLSQGSDALIGVHLGFQPDNGLGFVVRYLQFGTHSGASGTVAVGEGALIMNGADSTPHIVSTDGNQAGSIGYQLNSSTKVWRADFLPSWSVGLAPGAWIAPYAGLSILHVQAADDSGRKQEFLLFSKLPNGTRGPIGDHEIYTDTFRATMSAQLVGVMAGLGGEYCVIAGPVRRWIIHGDFAMAMFPWGSGNLTGDYTPVKDSFRVNVAGGFAAPSVQTLLSGFQRPVASYDETVSQTVKTFDGTIGLKLRIRPEGKRIAYDVGVAGKGLLVKDVPGTSSYVIHDGFAPGNGTFSRRSGDVSAKALTLTFTISR